MSEVENIIPVFSVSHLQQSIDFYISKLDFQLDWKNDHYCFVSRDGHCLTTETQVIQPPQNNSFAYHMKITDSDGNIIWFGTEHRE